VKKIEFYKCRKEKKCEEEKADRGGKKAYWADIAARGWGNDLQAHMKSSLPPPPGSYRGVYVGSVPVWCIRNQHQRKMLLDLHRGGASCGGARPVDSVAFSYGEPTSLYGPAASHARFELFTWPTSTRSPH
jgi:hypothetical protein